MLNQANRLAKVRDFNLLMKSGRWANGTFVDLKYLPLQNAAVPKKEVSETFKFQLRVAITVGLKISKSAVKRNRVKRQMREVVRLMIKDSKLRIGHYLLFVAKKGILEKEYAEISEEMILLLNKASIITGK